MLETPIGFKHELPLDLFTLDRIEQLVRRAPAGAAHIRTADDGFERTRQPEDVDLRGGSLANAIGEQKLHVYVQDVHEWAPEYEPLRQQAYDAAGLDRSQPLYTETCNIRVFSPEAPVALHADGETQINCGVGGRTIWTFSTPSGLSQEEHEALLRGGQFLPWRELEPWKAFDLSPGDGCAAPPRWPHWLEHPGEEPAVSFEVGYWTAEAVRERKVYEVNWLMRKTRVFRPVAPHVNRGADARKQKVFDTISLLTRKGTELRGV